MPGYRIFYLLMIILFFSACSKTSRKKQVVVNKPPVIIIQPFKDIDPNDIDYVAAHLKDVYPALQVKTSEALPMSAYYANRGRYRADSLIRILSSRTKEAEVMIGLTGKDISTSKGNIADWGVMGLGYCPGKACVVSTFRVSPQYRQQQLFKVALHELGHTQGLPHCSIATCLMRDAEGNNHLNEETAFCEKCKAILIKKGWQLNINKPHRESNMLKL